MSGPQLSLYNNSKRIDASILKKMGKEKKEYTQRKELEQSNRKKNIKFYFFCRSYKPDFNPKCTSSSETPEVQQKSTSDLYV